MEPIKSDPAILAAMPEPDASVMAEVGKNRQKAANRAAFDALDAEAGIPTPAAPASVDAVMEQLDKAEATPDKPADPWVSWQSMQDYKSDALPESHRGLAEKLHAMHQAEMAAQQAAHRKGFDSFKTEWDGVREQLEAMGHTDATPLIAMSQRLQGALQVAQAEAAEHLNAAFVAQNPTWNTVPPEVRQTVADMVERGALDTMPGNTKLEKLSALLAFAVHRANLPVAAPSSLGPAAPTDVARQAALSSGDGPSGAQVETLPAGARTIQQILDQSDHLLDDMEGLRKSPRIY
ncbi:MAG: hypothetical protein WC869_08145 [Phycisphaerae bacterium]|jgi:hypothetical protein